MASSAAEVTIAEIAAQELFRSVDVAAVAPLLRSCPVLDFPRGELLIRAGEPNHHLFMVLGGRVSVRLGAAEAAPLIFVGPGENVGELSLIDRKPASAFVVAEERSRVLSVDEELMWMLANTSHAISSNLLFMLAKRLRYGNDVIYQDREQLREYRFHATVDGLTGLFNRYWLDRMLPRQMDRSRKNDRPLSLIMIDIDNFKNFNDTYGHVAGDHAICAVATALRENLRPSDMAARYGGEEFVVLLPESTLDDADRVAERLRNSVRNTSIRFEGGPTLRQVTISLGVAQMTTARTAEQLVGECDAGLYRAKRAGRDRVST